MTTSLDAATRSLLHLALDGAVMRHQAIARNLAHASTPGYLPLGVPFEQRVREARDRIARGETADAAVADSRAQLQPMPDGGDRVALDLQAAQLAQNVVHYQALIKGYAKRMSILSMAVNEGKR